MSLKRKDDVAQRLLDQYLEHVDRHRSDPATFAGSGVVMLDVMRYRLHVPTSRRAVQPLDANHAMKASNSVRGAEILVYRSVDERRAGSRRR